jgi:hypothetical protein
MEMPSTRNLQEDREPLSYTPLPNSFEAAPTISSRLRLSIRPSAACKKRTFNTRNACVDPRRSETPNSAHVRFLVSLSLLSTNLEE